MDDFDAAQRNRRHDEMLRMRCLELAHEELRAASDQLIEAAIEVAQEGEEPKHAQARRHYCFITKREW